MTRQSRTYMHHLRTGGYLEGNERVLRRNRIRPGRAPRTDGTSAPIEALLGAGLVRLAPVHHIAFEGSSRTLISSQHQRPIRVFPPLNI